MSKKGKRHPIKGALGGLFLGLAVVLLLVIFSISPVKTFTPYYFVVGGCFLLGLLWGIFGPARRRKSKAPAPKQPVPVGPSAAAAAGPPPAPVPAPAPEVPPEAAPAAPPAPPPAGPPPGPTSGLPPA
jgi:hypothetical protein